MSPACVPAHLVDELQQLLDHDERMRVISKVPTNTPATHGIHRLVVVPKKNGKIRRTVDFKHLNMSVPRQPQHTDPPSRLYAKYPWIHSKLYWTPEKDITLCWWTNVTNRTQCSSRPGIATHTTLPQGLCVAGDAYTHRYNKITTKFDSNSARIIDNTIL